MPNATEDEAHSTAASIFVRSWVPVERPVARILMIHGIAEHSGRYEPAGERLAAAGFDVRAFDLPGFGRSAGRRAYVERWDDYLDVVAVQLRSFRDGLPTTLLGHSMGALIALTYVIRAREASRPMPDLLVLTGPPIGRPPLPAATRLAAPVLARLLPTLELSNGLHRDQLSRDPSVGARYHADALVYPRSTARLGNELFTAMSAAERELTRGDPLPVPTLVLHGSEDSIASPANARPLREIANCEYRLLPGLRHEVLNEPEGPEVVDQIAAWIRSNVEELALRPKGPAAAGPPAPGLPAPGPATPGSPASPDAASTAAGR